MRVLLLNQFFWPDASATSQLLTDVARALAAEGHEVHAVCADAGYAFAEAGDPPLVTIHRLRSLPFSRGRAGRLLSYLSFYIRAVVTSLTIPCPDVVLTLTTPPLISLVGSVLKRVRGSRHIIWEMDVYPDVAVALGYLRAGGVADRLLAALADRSRRDSDGIIALGECMKQRLIRHGLAPEKIVVAENWADAAAITPQPRPGDPGKLILLYSGNLGLAHDLATIKGAIQSLRSNAGFLFLFAGDGGHRKSFADFCVDEGLKFVEFRPYVARANLGDSLAAGDIGLVTQSNSCCGAVVPSKVYGLMAAGRPVLFIGPQEATPARIIRRYGCGWSVECGDVAGLTALLLRLASRPDEVKAAGSRARRVLLDHYDLHLGVARIVDILSSPTPLEGTADLCAPANPDALEPLLHAPNQASPDGDSVCMPS